MPSGSTVFVALFSVSYVAGITGTIFDHAEHAAYNLADGAHMDRFALATRSTTPEWEWYSEGMQLFAFRLSGRRWKKHEIWWGFGELSEYLPQGALQEVFHDAFAKWEKQTPLDIRPVGFKQPDIRVTSKTLDPNEIMVITHYSTDETLDRSGLKITVNDRLNWFDKKGDDYRDLRFAALHYVGRILGLDTSTEPAAIMYHEHGGFKPRENLVLHDDDIQGIKKLYPGTRFGRTSRW